jgi:hypothetical protein
VNKSRKTYKANHLSLGDSTKTKNWLVAEKILEGIRITNRLRQSQIRRKS